MAREFNERDHPRWPAEAPQGRGGRFRDAGAPGGGDWAQRLSDAIGGGSPTPPPLPDFPDDGVRLQAVEITTRKRWRDDYGNYPDFEMWDPIDGMWRSGHNARAELGTENLLLGNEYSLATFTAHAPVYTRRANLDVDAYQRSSPFGRPPDPNTEYYSGLVGSWVPGDKIEVSSSGFWFFTAGSGGRYGFHEQRHGDLGDDPLGTLLDSVPAEGEVKTRPHIKPLEWFYTRPQSPDPREASFYSARVLRGQDLIDHPQLAMGGWQIKGPDGRWHTIEEVYQDDPDEEVVELIADGYHVPDLDTSEEIVVRPQQWDY